MKRFSPVVFISCLLFLLSSCEHLFEYHPHQIILDEDEQNLTQVNLQKLQAKAPQDTLRLLVMGDTQRFYDATADFVDKANSFKDIDFVLHLGDISDFGMSQEFRWVHDIMQNLKWPYLTVIGNHDMLGNGRKLYQQMYGSMNYSFVYGHTKFVFLDTNGREDGFQGKVPDLNWLQQQLIPQPKENWQQAIVISHAPPFDTDFDPQLELPYHTTLANSQRVPLSLHGHKHSWTTEKVYDDQVLYHVTTSAKGRGFTYLKIWQDGHHLERIEF